MTPAILHVLDVACEGLVARVCLNDIEVFADWEGAARATQSKLNPYVLEGSNRLEVFLTPMTDDEGRPVEGPRSLAVTLLRGEHGRSPDEAERVAHFTWNPSQIPVEPGVLTGVWARQLTVRPEHSFGRWAWQDAPATLPTADDAVALVGLVGEVHEVLARRDLGALLALTALRNRELARALDLPEEEVIAEMTEMYTGWFEAPGWTLRPFDPGFLAATPQARGRLVRVTDGTGAPPIHGTDGERRFAFALTATRYDGRWTIAR